ncbi:MAG TPA: TraG family conjugative transposon ATPase [Puia sp.]|nr:TraG family conjugative transposon ATPase [Puia sp.]
MLHHHVPMPIGEVSDDALIAARTGAITAGLEFIHAGCHQSPEAYEAVNRLIVRGMSIFPADTIFHQQDYYWRRAWEPPDATPANLLARGSDAHFSGRPFFEHRCYFWITQPPPGAKPATWGSSALFHRHLIPGTLIDDKVKEAFRENVREFANMLEFGRLFRFRCLDAGELAGSERHPGPIEQYWHLAPPGRPPVIGDISFPPAGVRVQDRPCVIYTLADGDQLPESCSPWVPYRPYSTETTTMPVGFAAWLGPLLEVEHCVNSFIILPDRARLLADLEKRWKRLNSASGHARENAVARDSIARFLDEMAATQRMPVRMHLHVLAWADHDDNMPEIRQQVSAAINRMGATARIEAVGAPQLWFAGVPGNADQLPLSDTCILSIEQAACFLIKDALDTGAPGTTGIRLCERHSGRPILVDVCDAPKRMQWTHNLHKLVFAGSGAGKSYFMLLMTHAFCRQGAHCLLIDIGGSYRRLCELLKGKYYAYTEDRPVRFNPFRIGAGDALDTEKKESLKNLLLTLWKKTDEPHRRSEYVALSNALHGYYEWLAGHTDIAASFNSFYEYVRDTYSHALKKAGVQQEEFDLDNFLYVLTPFYRHGEYEYLLNAEDQPNLLQEPLIVFDIDAIKDHPILFPVVTIIIMEVFISKMRRLAGDRKVIVIEEAWKAIAKEGMAEYIRYLFKTLRKFNGEAIVVTQEIEDVIASPIVKNTIVNNADTKILLDQSKLVNRFDQVRELLGLTELETANVLSVNKSPDPKRKYKEVAVCYANGPSTVYGVETSLEEYLAFTSEESERVLVEKYARDEGGLEKGIVTLAEAIRSGAVKLCLALVLTGLLSVIPHGHARAQVLEIVGLVDAAAKKVIVAADLEVQRAQTQTIALQEAERALENSMAGGLLDDITGWVQQQHDLYAAYYQELWQVKSALGAYSKTASMIDRQVELIREEQRALAAVEKDPHFSAAELRHIATVYAGILGQAGRSVGQIRLVIQSYVTQMDDAGRLQLIDETNRAIDTNVQNLRQFIEANALLSLQRAKDENDMLMIKALYNLP